MRVRYQMTFKSGPLTVARILGRSEGQLASSITVDDVLKVPEVETYLEKMLGLRVHIESTLVEPEMTHVHPMWYCSRPERHADQKTFIACQDCRAKGGGRFEWADGDRKSVV